MESAGESLRPERCAYCTVTFPCCQDIGAGVGQAGDCFLDDFLMMRVRERRPGTGTSGVEFTP